MADIAFEASGNTLEELFESACEAMAACQVRKPQNIEPREEKEFELEADNEELLLHMFLEEIVFLRDTEGQVFSGCKADITRGKKMFLHAVVYGESIDNEKHEPTAEIKAVTYHKYEVKKNKEGWVATVILDV